MNLKEIWPEGLGPEDGQDVPQEFFEEPDTGEDDED